MCSLLTRSAASPHQRAASPASRRRPAGVNGAARGRPVAAVLLALLLVAGAGCLTSNQSDAEVPARQTARAEVQPELSAMEAPAVVEDHITTRTPTVEAPAGPAVSALSRSPETVEELLKNGLHLAGASPVHLASRTTLAASSVRWNSRGIARPAARSGPQESIRACSRFVGRADGECHGWREVGPS